MTGTAPDLFWERLKNRDASAEGSFVYGVTSTGVYCCPGCPSRLPQRKNIRFFASGADAARAGFRPCRRCQPDGAPLAARQAEAISRACALIEEAEGKPDFDAVAEAVGMSRHHFHRTFKKTAGVTPGAYLRGLQRGRALDGFARAETVTEAIHGAGYGSSSRFYESCAPALGMKPRSFAKGGAGEVIQFALGECSLGSLAVAATPQGICAIELDDAPGSLVERLKKRFPNATIEPGGADFERVVAEAVSLVEAPERGVSLPLHIRGTAFQQKVWEALRNIPPGETRTYAQVAAAAGCPNAVRAVAGAIAANPLAVAIPCHRVIGAGGALCGYRWGAARKLALLKREGAL